MNSGGREGEPSVGPTLLFSNLYPTPADRGRGVFIQQLASELVKHMPLVVICPLPWLPRKGVLRRWFSAAYNDETLPYHRADQAIDVYYLRYPLLPKISEPIHAWLMLIFCWRRLNRIVRRHNIRAVLGHWVYPDGLAIATFSRRRRLPVVLTALGSDINRDLHRPVIGSQVRRALRLADFVTTVSEPLRDAIQRTGISAERIRYIPTGVDQVKFAIRDRIACRAALGIDQREIMVVAVGRLVPVKGYDILLNAVALIPAHHLLKVYIIGEGPLRESLNADAQRLGIGKVVKFLGEVSHLELPQWLGAAHALCLSSRNEGQPNVVLESLSAGRPVVATDVGGIRQLVNAENGVVCAPKDPQALSEALIAVFSRPWDPVAIRASVAAHTFAAQAGAYVDILERLHKDKLCTRF